MCVNVSNHSLLYDVYNCNAVCKVQGLALRELCLVRDGVLFTDLDREDVLNFIDVMCVS